MIKESTLQDQPRKQHGPPLPPPAPVHHERPPYVPPPPHEVKQVYYPDTLFREVSVPVFQIIFDEGCTMGRILYCIYFVRNFCLQDTYKIFTYT